MLDNETTSKFFLRNVEITPRNTFLHYLENNNSKNMALEQAFESRLRNIFCYPSAEGMTSPQVDDQAIDIFVEAYAKGFATEIHVGTLFMPAIWRPMISLRLEVTNLRTGKNLGRLKITRRISWGEYLASLFQWKVFLGWANPASNPRMEMLLEQVAIDLKAKLER